MLRVWIYKNNMMRWQQCLHGLCWWLSRNHFFLFPHRCIIPSRWNLLTARKQAVGVLLFETWRNKTQRVWQRGTSSFWKKESDSLSPFDIVRFSCRHRKKYLVVNSRNKKKCYSQVTQAVWPPSPRHSGSSSVTGPFDLLNAFMTKSSLQASTSSVRKYDSGLRSIDQLKHTQGVTWKPSTMQL